MMKLSLKAIRFIIEALDHYRRDHDRRLNQEELTEEETSDLMNDVQYLAAIKQDFEKYRDELVQQHATIRADA